MSYCSSYTIKSQSASAKRNAYSRMRNCTLRSFWSLTKRSVLPLFGIQCTLLPRRQDPKVALRPEFGSINPSVLYSRTKSMEVYIFRNYAAFRMGNTDSLPNVSTGSIMTPYKTKKGRESKGRMGTSETYFKCISTVYCIAWRNRVPKWE